MSYGLFGGFIVGKEDKAKLEEILLAAAGILEDNPKCINYIIGESGSEEEVLVWEIWTDKAAHDESLKDTRLLELIMTAKPLIKGQVKSYEFSRLKGKRSI